MDAQIISSALQSYGPFVGVLFLVLVYNHVTFNKYQKNLTSQSEAHAKGLLEAYDNANKNVVDSYKKIVEDLRNHIDYLNERLVNMETKDTKGRKGHK